jgi:stearoyl-CoA desaturase (delta-9 desaturase)
MSLKQKIINLIFIVGPFFAIGYLVYRCWGSQWLSWVDAVIFVVSYLLTCAGISIGYHRFFTHRAFKTSPIMVAVLGVLGSMAVEGRVIHWVADHRVHHNFSDQEGDPHSPHLHGDGIIGQIKGLFHAHVGWFFKESPDFEEKYAKDLLADPVTKTVDRLFFPLALLSLLIPALIGYAVFGSFAGALSAFLWGGVVRMFLLHHVTFSVNSICHFVGRRRFKTKDQSRNVWWLALLSLGESWHHNHHAFPSSASHGLAKWEIDLSAVLISAMEKAGVVWDVVKITPELQAKRRAAAIISP